LTLGTNGGNGNVTLATGANQTLEIGGTDTDSMTIVTSGGPALSLSSTIFTDTGSTTTIASGGQTKDNTLALTGTVSDANGVNLVQIYDGATLLGTANFTAESATNWGFVTAALPDGIHSLTAKATDNGGASTVSDAVHISVLPSPPPPTNRPALISIVATDPVAIEGTNCWPWPGLPTANNNGIVLMVHPTDDPRMTGISVGVCQRERDPLAILTSRTPIQERKACAISTTGISGRPSSTQS